MLVIVHLKLHQQFHLKLHQQFQNQVQGLRSQIDHTLKSHQNTKDQMASKDKQLQEVKQQVYLVVEIRMFASFIFSYSHTFSILYRPEHRKCTNLIDIVLL